MAGSKSIVVVIDHKTHNQHVIDQIQQAIAGNDSYRIVLLSVIPRIPARAYQIPSLLQWEIVERNHAKQALQYFGELLNINSQDRFLFSGKPVSEAKNLAKRMKAEKIIYAQGESKSYVEMANYLLRQGSSYLKKLKPVFEIVKRRVSFN